MAFRFNQEVMDIASKHANAADIVGPELNQTLDRALWDETIHLQKQFNESVAPGWLKADKYDFWMAILDETVEVLGSKHWKWWKDKRNFGNIDWQNIEVEMVDLFLFILSLSIKEELEDIFYVTLASAELTQNQQDSKNKIPVRDDKFFSDFWEHFLTAVSLKTTPLVIIKWVEFWYRSGGTSERLLRQFRVKAALNDIRQEFGYASGKYKKDWGGVEDNVVAWKLANEMPLDINLLPKLTESLRVYYLEKVAL